MPSANGRQSRAGTETTRRPVLAALVTLTLAVMCVPVYRPAALDRGFVAHPILAGCQSLPSHIT